jgi:hypothetical protein
MPYNVDKDKGGDNKENTKWMEDCVNSVMSKDSKMDKSNAIAICKAQLNKKKESSLEFTYIDQEVWSEFNTIRESFIRKAMNQGYTFDQSKQLFNKYLEINNHVLPHKKV